MASEAADLVFHALVGLADRGLHLHDVARLSVRQALIDDVLHSRWYRFACKAVCLVRPLLLVRC